MHRADVGVDQLHLAFKRHILEFAEGAEAGVVDQKVYLLVFEVIVQIVGILLAREVDSYHAHIYAVELVAQLVKLVGAAGGDDQVIAELGEVSCELFSDSGACSGD